MDVESEEGKQAVTPDNCNEHIFKISLITNHQKLQ